MAVVDHGLHAIVKADLAQPAGEVLARGQWMPPAIDGPSCELRAVGAEVVVQVSEDGAGDVAVLKQRASGSGLHQVKAAVKNHQRRAAGVQGLQLGNADQGGVGWLSGRHRRTPGMRLDRCAL